MNNYEKFAFLANIALIIIIITQLVQYWIVAVPMLLILVIILLHKINMDKNFEGWHENELRWDTGIKENSGRIDELNENVIEWKVENTKKLLEIEDNITRQKKESDETADKNFRLLVGRISEVENRLNLTKRNLATYILYLEKKFGSSE